MLPENLLSFRSSFCRLSFRFESSEGIDPLRDDPPAGKEAMKKILYDND